MIKLLTLFATLAFLGFGVVLGLLNPTLVSFDYFFDQRHIPLSILLSISFVSGMLFAGLFVFTQVMRLQWKLHRLNKHNKQQTIEIIELKKQLHRTPSAPLKEIALKNLG